MKDRLIQKVVVVGGGAAGWLVASRLSSAAVSAVGQSIAVTLVESSDEPTLGVGEGTWPSMRETLKKIGLSEKLFVSRCDASFKQGSKFVGWGQDSSNQYYHPFSLPNVKNQEAISFLAQDILRSKSYAELVCPNVKLAEKSLAPKLITTDDYGFLVNYGYHLDANKFGQLLREHSVNQLNVSHVIGTVTGVSEDEYGYIEAIHLQGQQSIRGDLFIDCSGFSSVLMKKHYAIKFKSQKSVLFNDSAIAVQVPYPNENTEINSYTLSTAQKYGWIWDIGLGSRRGVGYTFASDFVSDEEALGALTGYVCAGSAGVTDDSLSFKTIKFNPGYLEKFWHKNCIAVGVSSGFIEPLEASALVMIELAADMLVDRFPSNFESMGLMEMQYNQRFTLHWERIVEFLKLHYVLSDRQDTDYWQKNRHESSVPSTLLEKMKYWEFFPPQRYDDVSQQDLFPIASYQYVMYGMGYAIQRNLNSTCYDSESAVKQIESAFQVVSQLEKSLPSNRSLLSALKSNSSN